MRSQWLLVIVLAVGVVVMAGLWYTASRQSEALPSQAEGVYVEGVAGAPSRINPLFAAFNDVDTDLSRLVFSGLTRLGPDGEVLPDLAEGWEVTPDGLTYTFHLRSGVSWHDGQPFTADDVVFTFAAIQESDFRGDPPLANLFHSLTFAKVDDLTVEVTLSQPFVPFLAYASIGILPGHLLSGLDAEGLFNAPFNQRPVGTGPYRLVDLTSQSAVLETHEGHHLGEPHIRRLELRFFNDEATLLRSLREGVLQGAFFRSPLNTTDLLYLQTQERYTLLHPSSSTYTILYFNNASPFFQDARVRQALAYALDRDYMVSAILEGQGLRLDSPVPAGTWAHYPTLDRYRFDAAQAARLLDEAGWLVNPFGVREKDGQPLKFDLVTNEDKGRIAVAEEIARTWSSIGIQATVRTKKATDLLRDALVPRQFDTVLYGFDSGLDPDPYPNWHSTQIRPGGGNLAGFDDPRADVVLEDARQANDVQRRGELYREFQEIFAQELPSLPLFHRTSTYAVDSRLQDVLVGILFDSGSRFAQVRQWYFPTR